MQMRKLGSQGPEISVVGYGAWEIGGEAYGPNADDQAVIKAIHAGLDAGINWIDTAEVYGKGNSELLVGKAVKGRRDDVLIATKVGADPVGTGFKPAQIKEAVKKSLQRLDVEYVDLYQLHWFPDEPTCPIEETWGAMSDLVDEGLVRHIGVSNFNREQIQRCLAVRHCDSLQPQLSMLHRQGSEMYEWCESAGVGVIVYGPLAYGLLTGVMTVDTTFDHADWRSGRNPDHPYYVELFAPGRFEKHVEFVEKLRPLADKKSITIGQLSLAWTFHQQGVTAAIAGSRNPEHNKQNAAAGDAMISDEEIQEILKMLPPIPTPSK